MEKLATLNEIREYFGMTATEFRTQWLQLSDASKQQIREGIGNGSLTY